MINFLEIEPLLERLLKTISKNRMLIIGPKSAGFSDIAITAENLEDMAGNHFFDDYPHKYNITKMEGHRLRAFFQEGSSNYNFVTDLHKRFHNIMEPERDEYIKRVNNRRIIYGLAPINKKDIDYASNKL
jgi:hypothetical protein